MELVDCHVHSTYSDGASSLADNVACALQRKITTLCCTDHLTLPASIDPTCEVSIPETRLASYVDEIARIQADSPVEVICGFEADYYPGCEPNIARWSRGASFLLGSVHLLDGRWIDDLDDLSYWDEMGTDAIWTRYFEVWAQACACPVKFDSMAHPDLVSLLGRMPSPHVLETGWRLAVDAASSCGVHIEINTAGCTKPLGHPYPHDELLHAFCKAGVPLTVGSDAHSARRVGEGIDLAYRLAYEAGYRSIDVPTPERTWRPIEL